ncbi:MAG: DUF1294 domain-containing protein [Calditrichaeota bacterium]|nr:DUF1294 domain-containing protein [Spirochaetales bacterium]RQW04864.1 MAG: DUF1294 domain-containing protein [Calditrichota bacterium]
MLKKIFLILIIIMNIAAFVTVKIDKDKAINGDYRISEVKLVAISSFGAVPGTLLGFKVFNHKTNKNKKGYLWDALYLVAVQNVILYTAALAIKPKGTKEKTLPLYHRRNIDRY